MIGYFKGLSCGDSNPPLISDQMMLQALNAWFGVWAVSGFRLPAPDAAPAEDGRVFYGWDRAEHHLDMEVFENGQIELFYRNRTTGDLWEDDIYVGQEIPSEALEKFQLFE